MGLLLRRHLNNAQSCYTVTVSQRIKIYHLMFLVLSIVTKGFSHLVF